MEQRDGWLKPGASQVDEDRGTPVGDDRAGIGDATELLGEGAIRGWGSKGQPV